MSNFTEAQLQALDAAIAQGAIKVKYADKEVTYRDLDEMKQIRNMMAADLGKNKRKPSRTFASFSKGL